MHSRRSNAKHYTPDGLGDRLASEIGCEFTGVVIDAAVGSGNLLSAVARLAPQARLLGLDVDAQAISQSARRAEHEGWAKRATLRNISFFSHKLDLPSGASYVLNPPYLGYATLSTGFRRMGRRLGLKGRFDLSYLFVTRTAIRFGAAKIVALIPSTWSQSTQQNLAALLRARGFKLRWTRIGPRQFQGIDVDVGILTAETSEDSGEPQISEVARGRKQFPVRQFEIRQGLATGADETYVEIASHQSNVRTITGLRGRDIGSRQRSIGRSLWLANASDFETLQPKFKRALRRRYCTSIGGRLDWEYHERLPSWFVGEPKVLIPEILTAPRVQFDFDGRYLPLRSVFAIRVSDRETGQRVVDFLSSEETWRHLISAASRTGAGSVRITRESLARLDWASAGLG